ncbi:MAG: LytTR family DNA-binding domain-containing protein [Bacteroidota bacterium]
MTLSATPSFSQAYHLTPYRILIVEATPSLAERLERYLGTLGHQITGRASSYETAVQQIEQQRPDLVLLALQLNGPRSGIELAQYLQSSRVACPFIYLSAQLDAPSLEAAKATFPEAYLLQPIQPQRLFATIELVMYRRQFQERPRYLQVSEGGHSHLIPTEDILFLQSRHVYLQIYQRNDDRPLLHRASLKELASRLPTDQFLQPHRSFLVNRQHIRSWNNEYLAVEGHQIPISRARRRAVLEQLHR